MSHHVIILEQMIRGRVCCRVPGLGALGLSREVMQQALAKVARRKGLRIVNATVRPKSGDVLFTGVEIERGDSAAA